MKKKRKAREIWAVIYDDGGIHTATFARYQAEDTANNLNNTTYSHGRTFTVVKFREVLK